MSLYDIPTKQETYSVAARKLTDEELRMVINEVDHVARTYFDSAENNGGPRNWPSYEAFLGFHIANVGMRYQLDRDQLQVVVKGVYEEANRFVPTFPVDGGTIDPVALRAQRFWLLQQPGDEAAGLTNLLDHLADRMAERGETRQLLTDDNSN